MELRQLEYFVAVVEEASFTRAAERVLVAQSGVSAQVRRLEAELGIALLDRGGRTVTLTEAGAAVLPFARAALAAVGGVREAVDALRGLTRGHVRVGMVTAGPAVTLTDLLASFNALHPEVEITLIEDASDALFAALRSGELDLACASLGPNPPEGVETHVIIDAAVVAAVHPGHPLARREAIEPAELAAYPLICLPRGTGVRALWDAKGVRARVAFEASDPSVLAQLAARGLGVAILPEPAAAGLHTLALGLRGQIALAWRPGGPSSPAARAFMEHARGSV
ncbi:LysR substrate-binding domain-containing protein [Solirubrobacter ginsenosidimutans]|uniref:LysR substrate-binding domain-containing protein n=1 Tax=Solirubrobacter ginsenosidimutans TaxID=490573 RepID=A0A9X3S4G8_9ACTN|nr:LysR substrate-binding domain-containing protein [Solirubrobacter ginsenosidimutans]MDA0166680.1 LysR substrate-binding domain-containing protein [Solirubrobacter ginsenosidimutans]